MSEDTARGVPGPTEPDLRGPWLGLESYTERYARLFFGRVKETDDVLRLLGRRVLAILFGPSGIGKTSLLRAGLFPRLAGEGFLPIYIRIDYGASAPPFSRQVIEKVRAELAVREVIEERDDPGEPGSLWEYVHYAEFYDRRKLPVTPVLCFDQFEEIFTIGQSTPIAGECLRELTDLIEDYIPGPLRKRIEEGSAQMPARYGHQPYRIVLSLREEYVYRLDRLRRDLPSMTLSRYPLMQMNGDQALEAIQNPGGNLVSREVALSIVRFVAGASLRDEPGDRPGMQDRELGELQIEPALLSVICSELDAHRVRAGEKEITLAQLTTARNHILDDFYDQSRSAPTANASHRAATTALPKYLPSTRRSCLRSPAGG